MTTLYLIEPQTLVKRDGETLVVHIPANEESGTPRRKQRVPLIKIDRVVVQGTSTLTSPAIAALMERRADVVFLNRYGKFQGHLSPAFTRNGQLRLAQAAAHASWERRQFLARSFVEGKVHNMRTMVLRFNRKVQHEQLKTTGAKLKQTLVQVAALPLDDVPGDSTRPQADSTWGRLQGLEGNASALYFATFQHILKTPELFNGRTRRPPRDPANALLSYGYTILLNQVVSALCTVGLDPYIGYLHGTKFGKPALALDLMEEFRPIIVDSVMLTLFNTDVLGAKDFREEFGAYRLSDRGRRLFLTRLEGRFNDTIRHPTFEYKATYRRCIELQARLLAKTVTGEIATYPPFRVR
jgi:CRISPR-associated protein Cas1